MGERKILCKEVIILWCETASGDLINLNLAEAIYVEAVQYPTIQYEDKPYQVIAEMSNHQYILDYFETQKGAQRFVEKLGYRLNVRRETNDGKI